MTADASILVPVALFGFIPFVLFLFAILPPRRAALVSFILGYLFLPVAGYDLPGLPDYTRRSAPSIAVLLAVLCFDGGRLARWRLRWIDAPILVICFGPFVTSMTNGLGWYDGLTASVTSLLLWGVPYLIGRLYFSDAQGLRELAIGIFVGGLIYVPLCLLEVRFSPQLHTWIYGFHQHDWVQTVRFGGFRPTVFLQHGLAVGMWMSVASAIGLWLWKSKNVQTISGLPMGPLVVVLLITTVLCKSLGALALLLLGLGTLYVCRKTKSRLALVVLLLMAPAYIAGRVSGNWHGEPVVGWVEEHISEERAFSVTERMRYEDMLIERGMERPWFGWGGWGRNRVHDEFGADMTITDGLWIITLGTNGFVALIALVLLLQLPAALIARRTRVNQWLVRSAAPAMALALILCLYMIDCVLNAMTCTVFTIASGGLLGASANGTLRQVFGGPRGLPADYRTTGGTVATPPVRRSHHR